MKAKQFLSILMFHLALFQVLSAQTNVILHPAKVYEGMQFGRAVAFAGPDWLIASSISSENTSAAGSIYVYNNSTPAGWRQQQQLIPPDCRADDYFGLYLAATPQKCIVTSYKNDEAGENAGAAYYYQQNGNKWQLQQKIIPANIQPFQLFGSAVAMTEQTAFISAVADAGNGFQSGAVYVYAFVNNNWQEKQKITPPNAHANAEFGHALSMSNNTAAIGAWGKQNEAGKRCGSVYMYTYSNNQWQLQQEITPPAGQENDRFG